MSLEHGNNFEKQAPVIKTGVSEPKEFKNPSDNLNEINQREKIDKSISEIGLQEEETKQIVDTIVSIFGNDEKAIDSILQNISSDISIDSKDKVMGILVEAEKTKVEAEKTKVEAEKTKVEAEKTKVEAEKTKVEAEKTKVEAEKTKVEAELVLQKNQKFDKLKSYLQLLSGEKSKIILDILNNDSDKDKFDKVIETLKNPLVFNEVATELKAKSPEKYREFINTLIQIDPSFREIEVRFGLDSVGGIAKLKLGTDNLNGVDLSKNILRQEKDGAVIEAGKNSRNLSLVGSDYKLDSKLNNNRQLNVISFLEKKLQNDLKPINETLNTISSVIDYLDKAISNNLELKDIKENIKNTNINLYNELGIENLNSISDIKNVFVGLQKQKEKEKEDKIKEAKASIDLFIKQNADIAKEQDEKKKDILKFLSSIGFDSIPQSITDNLINQLNLNSSLRSKLGFTMQIDIANGILGTDSDANISNITSKEKADFARAFNIMISGDESGPINLDSILNARGVPISDMRIFSAQIAGKGLNDPGKAIGIMKDNIAQFGNEETK